MILLKINDEYHDSVFRIQKENRVLDTGNYIMNFYLFFYRKIVEKDDKLSIIMNDISVDSKNYVLVNLLDFEQVIKELYYKKGSLLYEYVNVKIMKSYDCFDLTFFTDIYNECCNCFRDTFVAVSPVVEENLIKLIQNFYQFSVDYSDCETIYRFIFEILKLVMEENPLKKYIIFYNSEILHFDFSKFDNCYSFDVAKNYEFKNYNFMIGETVFAEIERLWPNAYRFDKIYSYLEKYFNYYFFRKKIILSEQDEIILATILNKIFDLKKNLIFDFSSLDNNVQSFLTAL